MSDIELQFADFLSRLRTRIVATASVEAPVPAESPLDNDVEFNSMALDLFGLQYEAVPPYRRLCDSLGKSPDAVRDWRDIPAAPAAAFKEFEMTSLAETDRTACFVSSGTTGHRPSRHFHSRASLQLYESAVLSTFRRRLVPEWWPTGSGDLAILSLTPPAAAAPNSSLAHMFQTVADALVPEASFFAGQTDADGAWRVDASRVMEVLDVATRSGRPVLALGTAFNFVHLLEALDSRKAAFALPSGSRMMETGGYKGRSRELPKEDLHRKLSRALGLPPSAIVSEYGMSELSSQAYDSTAYGESVDRVFRFPPWARARVVSPETGREAEEGAPGLLRIVDLANARSVMAVQTEDLAVRREGGFNLLGRAPASEPRGCSILSADVNA